jgi:hypothetical protein
MCQDGSRTYTVAAIVLRTYYKLLVCSSTGFQFVDLMGGLPSGEARFLEEGGRRALRDSQAIEVIKRIGRVPLGSDLLDMDKDRRDEVLALLKKEGLSIRQISRLTEINRGIIQKA